MRWRAFVQCFNDQHLIAHPHRHTFGPAAGDIGQREGVNKITAGLDATTVYDHVYLEEAWRRIAPVGKGAHRNTAPDRRTHSLAALALPVVVLARGGQCTVDGRRADLQDFGPNDRVQVKMAMPLHGIDQGRNQCLQALTADTICGLPQHRERLPDGFVVKTVAHGGRPGASSFFAQHTNGMLAVISRQSYEFVKDLDPVGESCFAISRSQRLSQFSACCHADLRLHVVLLPPDSPTGSNLREAIVQHG